eukprot:TRINITY_DN6006_c0_g1_i1.p1 TRINITY_DN6006_c0_g1~~TRINITY_DN6006_c0_g1_i1.p1  ORF type:complete len:612 (-),score=98.92 TRINITY_DN6006_c0_g1_i1:116-1951(-)
MKGANTPSSAQEGASSPSDTPEPMQHSPTPSSSQPISQVQIDSAKSTIEKDLLCPICLETLRESFVTNCGHSYCYLCISRHLESKTDCPSCGNTINKDNIYPNFILNKILEKSKTPTKSLVEEINKSLFGESNISWNLEDINTALDALYHKKRQLEQNEEELQSEILLKFLQQTRSQKLDILDTVKNDIELLNKDIQLVSERREMSRQKYLSDNDKYFQISNKLLDSEAVKQREERCNTKRRRIESHIEDLQTRYFTVRKSSEQIDESSLATFANNLSKFTQFSSFKVLATIKYGDIFNSSSIVSSIEFDKDDEYFATAGVTKKIKIFEYSNIINMMNDPVSVHYPIHEMACRSKISCLSWNSYIKAQISSSDYEGIVSLWDAFAGKNILSFEEHSKRVWSVDFSRIDPTRLASGSDDTTVKIWCTNQQRSAISIESQANICCVKFNPGCANYVAFGSADHHIHYYDLRKYREPLFVLRGHRKAVSYVKFLNRNELVSASTDSTLKLWNVDLPECTRTFTGHTNEKNFVGLTANEDFITCGSENNAVYAYYKTLSKPIFFHKFGSSNPVTGEESDEDAALFVSSVCCKMKNKSNVILAANSQGTIKVLELV